jgi:tripartite-type tricarboxylate transporter receptor subunit TctC
MGGHRVMENRMARLVVIAAVLAAVGVADAAAQDRYPSRPVRIVVSVGAASSPDIRARILADELSKTWGRPVLVENRPGGGGLISAQAVATAEPDGHTLLAATASLFTIMPAQTDRPPIDVNRDFVPIALIGSEGMVLAVSPKLGVTSLAELIAFAREKPYQLVIGTNPAGSLPHLTARLLVQLSGAPITVVPSTGGTNEAIKEIIGGREHGVIDSLPGLRGALDAQELQALAIMLPQRLPMRPELPTGAETLPGLTANGWQLIAVRSGTPEPIVTQLADDLRRTMAAPDVRARLDAIGTPFQPIFGADVARFVASEEKLWWPIVKEAAPR